MERIDGRGDAQPRQLTLVPNFVETADGSCLITAGKTRVICTASVEEGVPPFLRGEGRGWVTAEYAMLPASTGRRKARDGIKKDGRGVEIQRLIGRSLRQAVDMRLLGERTITLDCDVLQADGGTRTASITGAYVALVMAVHKLMQNGLIDKNPIIAQVAAISVGVVDGRPMLDLCYQEDSRAQTDMNLVMNQRGEFIELQGTGEGRPFTNRELNRLLDLGRAGVRAMMHAQREALRGMGEWLLPPRRVVVASGNAHKLKELGDIFGGMVELISMKDAGFEGDIEENGTTFEENAVIKAEAVSRATGLPALADDSGLSVDALDGAPGVYSARYCGRHGDDEANNDKLLEELAGVPEGKRAARFVSSICVCLPGGRCAVFEGVCPGRVGFVRRGTNGFGYDPLFIPDEVGVPGGGGTAENTQGRSYAELSAAEKDAISHRGRAMERMEAELARFLADGSVIGMTCGNACITVADKAEG